MKHHYAKLIATCLLCAIIISGCASSTLIDSSPSGASLYLNGKEAGVTPYKMTDRNTIFNCTSVLLEKEGYLPYYTTICRDEALDPAALIGGFYLFFPFFWAMKYHPSRTYKLISEKEAESPKTNEFNIETTKSEFEKLIEETRKEEEDYIRPE